MLKYAHAQIMSKALAPTDASARELRRFAHRHHFDYEVRPGFLYVRSRAISSRCNDNYDEFPAEELEKSWRTFIGKPVFVNHVNDDHKRARGVIIDAALHKDSNRDGTKDYWVEVLMEVDALRFPKLASEILKGNIARTSMGTDVAYSICSACGNKATTPAEYCRHIPAAKGQMLYRTTASGHKVGEIIRETCFGLKFFENSLLVEPPADPTAHFLGVDDRGLKGSAIARDSAGSNRDPFFYASATQVPEHVRDQPIGKSAAMHKGAPFAGYDDFDDCTAQNADKDDPDAYCGEIKHKVEDGKKESRLTLAELMAEGAQQYPNPADHPWFKETGLSHEHILHHWDQATPEEKHQGARWYPDAHLVAKSIAKLDPRIKDDKEAAHKGAGVLSAYSPQQGWWANMHNAARSFQEQRAIGKGEGIMVMGSHANAAQKILDGMPHHEALKGPKTQDFAHLIEHGGNDENGEPSQRVVIDRHALSVAAGRRLNADDVKGFPSQNRHYYEHAAEQYRRAAAVISDRQGRRVAPHEVQAVTWLVRQRLNSQEDNSPGQKGRDTVQRNQRKVWQDTSREHTPELHGEPPNSHVAALKMNAARGLSWNEIGERHPQIYGDPEIHPHAPEHADGEMIGWAANNLAHSTPDDPDAEGHSVHELTFHHALVSPHTIDHKRHEPGDYRVQHAAEGYRIHPEQMPPVVLVHRHGVYQVADGHHRAEAAKVAGIKKIHAYVTQSPFPDTPSEDGSAPYHGARSTPFPIRPGKDPGRTPEGSGYTQDRLFEARKLAYGEQKAPADVDTLREDACPVCGDRDTYDGATCQVCGYVAPPRMFQDPDLEKARQMDLRKDIGEFQDPNNPMANPMGPDQLGPDGQPIQDPQDPSALDANGNPVNPDAADPNAQPGSLPGEVQGEVQPGGDPMGGQQLIGPDGQVLDPAAMQQGMPNELGAPVDPSMLGPDGQPLQQPGQQMMVGPNGEPIGPQQLPPDAISNDGKPFTPGPNMPMGPGGPEGVEGPEGPVDQEELGPDGQVPNPGAGQGVPGTPGDGVPDLQCPACGFQADATNPVSVDMDTALRPPSGQATPDGVQAGDVCPNCGAAPLISPAEAQGQTPVPMTV